MFLDDVSRCNVFARVKMTRTTCCCLTGATRATAPTAWLVPPIENVPGSVPSILTTKRWEEEELLPQPKAGYVEEKQVE